MPGMSTSQGHETYFLPVSAPAVGGDTTIVPADAVNDPNGLKKRKIRVFSLVLFAKAAVTVTLKSNSTPISGAMALAANGGMVVQSEPSAHFLETAPGEALVATTTADGVYGWVGYTLETR